MVPFKSGDTCELLHAGHEVERDLLFVDIASPSILTTGSVALQEIAKCMFLIHKVNVLRLDAKILFYPATKISILLTGQDSHKPILEGI